jgi:hypothetical protein
MKYIEGPSRAKLTGWQQETPPLAGFRDHTGWFFMIIPGRVEVAGIEPASFSFSVGLLRAHPVK